MKRSTWSVLIVTTLVLAACGAPTPPSSIRTFTNTATIAIPEGADSTGPASVYPSSIVVADLPTAMTTVRVRLNGLSHTWPDDLDVLLVGPQGEHALLLSDAGGAADAVNVTLIFEASASAPVPDGGPIVSGAYLPSAYVDGDAFDAPAPAGPYTADLSVFDGTDPNGTWLLFVMDDLGGDVGEIAGGWSLTFVED